MGRWMRSLEEGHSWRARRGSRATVSPGRIRTGALGLGSVASVAVLLLAAAPPVAALGTGFNYAPFTKSTLWSQNITLVGGCAAFGNNFSIPTVTWDRSTGVGHLRSAANATACPTWSSHHGIAFLQMEELISFPLRVPTAAAYGLDPQATFRWSVNTSVAGSGACAHPYPVSTPTIYECRAFADTWLNVTFYLYDTTNSTAFDVYATTVAANTSEVEVEYGCTYYCVYSNATISPSIHYTAKLGIAPAIITPWSLLPSHRYTFYTLVDLTAHAGVLAQNNTGWPTGHARTSITLQSPNYWQLNYVYI